MKPHLLVLPIALLLAACGPDAPTDTPAGTAPAQAPSADTPQPPAASAEPGAATTTEPATGEPTGSAPAQADERSVDETIARLLGEPRRYRETIERLQAAVAAGDAAAVAPLARYPLEVRIGGEPVTIGNEQDFVARYAGFMTPDIRSAIVDTRYADLFVNGEGVMFGRGQAWLNGICQDAGCEAFDVRIVRLQPALE